MDNLSSAFVLFISVWNGEEQGAFSITEQVDSYFISFCVSSLINQLDLLRLALLPLCLH